MTTGSKQAGKSPSISGRRKSTMAKGMDATLGGARHSVVTGPRSKDPNNPTLDKSDMAEVVLKGKFDKLNEEKDKLR